VTKFFKSNIHIYIISLPNYLIKLIPNVFIRMYCPYICHHVHHSWCSKHLLQSGDFDINNQNIFRPVFETVIFKHSAFQMIPNSQYRLIVNWAQNVRLGHILCKSLRSSSHESDVRINHNDVLQSCSTNHADPIKKNPNHIIYIS